ncbi:MAG: serine/threonine-protein kinase, partial [Acidobacteriota bacterium]
MSADPVQALPARYRVVAEIGTGGMGRVYRAHDTVLGRDVAIKVIDRGDAHDTAERARFVREARAAARLHHPNIAVVHDVDPEAGWLVMELVEGESLRAVLKGSGPLPAKLAAKVAAQVLGALDAAHAAGVIHRDIKPSNIILAPDETVKLVDFGIARLVDVERSETGDRSGTPAYMAPEQLRGGKIDARTDLYSLGATLFELVVGERFKAFDASDKATLEVIDRACAGQRGLAHLIERCLQLAPDARFPSARDAAAALGRVKPLWPASWIALAVLVVAIGSIAGYVVGHRHREHDTRVERAFLLAQRGEND